jgi:hypothetical protein
MKNNDQLVASTAQGVLRGRLIEHFVNEQKATHGYLLLTADKGPSKRVPPALVVAEQWAWLRQNAGTIPEEVQKAEIDLMYAVSAGRFPELLMMNRTTSVELCFDRSLVEELAAKIGRKLEIEFDPWEAENKNTEPGAVTINTAVMTTEKCANMRPRDLGLPGNHDLFVVERYRGTLWAPRLTVVAFLTKRGVDPAALPVEWWELSPPLAQRTEAATKTITAPLKSRRGAPKKYDWEDAEQFAFQLFETRGDFDVQGNQTGEWRSQNDLVRKVQLYMASARGGGAEASDSRTKDVVARWVSKWRNSGQ